MSAYVIIQINVTNPEKYNEYKKYTPITVEKYDGRFIVRGGATEDVEGKLAYGRVVVIEFPTMEKARAWYHSPEYQAAKKIREGSGESVFTIVDGVD